MREIDKKVMRLELDFRDTLENEQIQKNNTKSDTTIKDVILVGKAEWKDRLNGQKYGENLYIVTKEVSIKDENGNEVDKKLVNNYYLGEKCIGGFMDFKEPIFNQYFESSEPEKIKGIKDLISRTTIEDLEHNSLNNLQNEYLEEMAEKLHISKEEIMQIDELDLEEKLPTEEELDEMLQEDENSKKKIRKDEFEKLDIKEETDLRQEIKGETLGQKLGLKKVGINDGVKLARVSTSDISSREGVSKSTVDTFVVIRKTGDAVILTDNVLKPNDREGTNPVQENLTLDNNDATVNKEANTSSYEIVNGNGREFLNIGYDENSGKEIKYSMYSNQLGKYVDCELETNRTFYQDPKVREFLRDRTEGQYEADNILSNFSREDVDMMARSILDSDNYVEIGEVYNQADVRNKIIDEIIKNDYKKGDEEKIEQEVGEKMLETSKRERVRGEESV